MSDTRNCLVLNISTIVRIASYASWTVDNVLMLREVNRDFVDAIDNYSSHVWDELLEKLSLFEAFNIKKPAFDRRLLLGIRKKTLNTVFIEFAKRASFEHNRMAFLLTNGADVNALDSNRNNALSIVCSNREPFPLRTVMVLLRHNSAILDRGMFFERVLRINSQREQWSNDWDNLIEYVIGAGIDFPTHINGVPTIAHAYKCRSFALVKHFLDRWENPSDIFKLIQRYDSTLPRSSIEYIRFQNQVDEYVKPGSVFGWIGRPDIPDEHFFWNKRSNVGIAELKIALEDAFGFTDLTQLAYRGTRRKPMINKLNELRNQLLYGIRS